MASPRDLRPVSPESISVPSHDGVGVDDDQAARPRRPRGSKRDPECPVDVVQRWAGALFLQRRHLLTQSEVFDHEVGSTTTHHPQRSGAKRDEENEYTEHGGGVSPSSARNSSGM